VSGLGLDYDRVAGLDALAGIVAVETFSGIFESDLENVGILLLAYALEVIVVLKLAASLTICTHKVVVLLAGDGTTSAAVKFYILVLVHCCSVDAIV
jgi:hypothetical protein